MRVCITGGAGFIGSNLAAYLLDRDVHVRIVDNCRTGRSEFVPHRAELHTGDILDEHVLLAAFDGCDWVVHLAANADVRHGYERPFFDLEQNTVGTARVLDAARCTGVNNIFFASTASVYGNYQADRIPEDCPFPPQNSLYGASKLAGEGLVAAYCEGYGMTGIVGRWVQILGEHYLHGHVIDFVRKLRDDPTRLLILGDGRQRKSGLYVRDLAAAIHATILHATPGYQVFNIGTDETFTVDESADLITTRLGVEPRYEYSGRTGGGWIGDNPYVLLDSTRIRALGWAPTLTIPGAIERTVDWLTSSNCTYL